MIGQQLIEIRAGTSAETARGVDGRCALAALSLGNLCCLAVWTNVFSGGAVEIALMKQPPQSRELLAIALAVVAIALFSYCPIRKVWCSAAQPALVWRLALAPLFACAFNGVRTVIAPTRWYAGLRGAAIGWIGEQHLALVVGVAALVFALALLRPFMLRAVLHFAVLLSPLLGLSFAYAGYVVVRASPSRPAPLARPIGTASAPQPRRVVWVVFDEWDYRLALSSRPAGLKLPYLDGLVAESTLFSDAHPPGADTIHSVLGSIYGRPLARVESDGVDLKLIFSPNGATGIGSAPVSLFEEARSQGMNASVSGWYLPYDRLFGAFLTRCHWSEFTPFRALRGGSVAAIAAHYLGQVVEVGGPLAPWTRAAHVENYQEILAHSVGSMADPAVDLAFVHMVVPHAPIIYDGRASRFRTGVALDYTYFDNLKLMDDTIGRILQSERRSARAADTVFIFSSDHRLRGRNASGGIDNDRVPLIVRWPGERKREEIPTALCTTKLKDLILGVLNRRIDGTAALRTWAKQHQGRCTAWDN